MSKDNSWMSCMNKQQQPQQNGKRAKKNSRKGNSKGNVASFKTLNRHSQ